MASKEEVLKYLEEIIPDDVNIQLQLSTHSSIDGRVAQKLSDPFPHSYFETIIKKYIIELTMDTKFNLPEG